MGYYTEIKSGALLGASIVFLVIAVWLLPKRVISKIQANDPTKTNEPIVEEPKDIIIDIPQEVEAELVKEVQ